jgi:diguanylate cyclase (GGDEF)-like protein
MHSEQEKTLGKLLSLTKRVRKLEFSLMVEPKPPFLLADEIESEVLEYTENLRVTNNLLREEIKKREQVEAQLIETIKERDRLISDLVSIQNNLEFQATHDGLTGLLNNVSIFDELKREVDRSSREGSHFGLILCDIDHFKKINDSQGHLAGDEVLRSVSANLKSLVRSYDSVGRYGGDEFLIILPGSSLEGTVHLAERIRHFFASSPLKTTEGTFYVTFSMGVDSLAKVTHQDIKPIIKRVDQALYKAKGSGRNCIAVARPSVTP